MRWVKRIAAGLGAQSALVLRDGFGGDAEGRGSVRHSGPRLDGEGVWLGLAGKMWMDVVESQARQKRGAVVL